MVFFLENCSDLMREKIVLVIEKNFWVFRSLQQLIQKVKSLQEKYMCFFFLFQGPVAASDVAKSLIPNDGLPYVSGVGPVENEELIQRFQNKDSVPFTLNRNLRVYVKLVNCKFVLYSEHITVQCTYVQYITIAIIFELIYHMNGYFRV